MKKCKRCGAVVDNKYMSCPECGNNFVPRKKLEDIDYYASLEEDVVDSGIDIDSELDLDEYEDDIEEIPEPKKVVKPAQKPVQKQVQKPAQKQTQRPVPKQAPKQTSKPQKQTQRQVETPVESEVLTTGFFIKNYLKLCLAGIPLLGIFMILKFFNQSSRQDFTGTRRNFAKALAFVGCAVQVITLGATIIVYFVSGGMA